MYQIFADEVLGSGQFGIVYGGIALNYFLYSIKMYNFICISPTT